MTGKISTTREFNLLLDRLDRTTGKIFVSSEHLAHSVKMSSVVWLQGFSSYEFLYLPGRGEETILVSTIIIIRSFVIEKRYYCANPCPHNLSSMTFLD